MEIFFLWKVESFLGDHYFIKRNLWEINWKDKTCLCSDVILYKGILRSAKVLKGKTTDEWQHPSLHRSHLLGLRYLCSICAPLQECIENTVFSTSLNAQQLSYLLTSWNSLTLARGSHSFCMAFHLLPSTSLTLTGALISCTERDLCLHPSIAHCFYRLHTGFYSLFLTPFTPLWELVNQSKLFQQPVGSL